MSTAISITSQSPESSDLSIAAADRYLDAYRQARALVSTGNAIKFAGWIIGGLLLFAAVATYSTANPQKLAGVTSGSGVAEFASLALGIAAILATFVIWICGVLVCARGQHLLAALDSAIYASPFLSNVQRARAMSLF